MIEIYIYIYYFWVKLFLEPCRTLLKSKDDCQKAKSLKLSQSQVLFFTNKHSLKPDKKKNKHQFLFATQIKADAQHNELTTTCNYRKKTINIPSTIPVIFLY